MAAIEDAFPDQGIEVLKGGDHGAVVPLCLGAPGCVRVSRIILSAWCANDVQIF